MISAMDFTEKLNKLLSENGLSQRDLVRILGDVSKDKVNRWFTGRSVPDIKEGLRLARALDVPLDYLADDDVDVAEDATGAIEMQALVDVAREVGPEKIFMPFGDEHADPKRYADHLEQLSFTYQFKLNALMRKKLEARKRRDVARIGAEDFSAEASETKPAKRKKGVT